MGPSSAQFSCGSSGFWSILPAPPESWAFSGASASWFPDSRHLAVNGGDFENTMLVTDSTDGSSRVIYRVTGRLLDPSVSPDGKKMLFSGGAAAEWDILDVSLADGQVHTLVGGGGVSWEPDWAPSATHFLFSTFGEGSGGGIVDRSAAEGFSDAWPMLRRATDSYALGPRWAPDGTRFLFAQGQVSHMQLAIANASGRRPIVLAENVAENAHAWSPDGQWVVFLRREGGKEQVVKMKPVAGATPIVLATGSPAGGRLLHDSMVPRGGLDRIPIGRRHLHDFPGRQEPPAH